MLRTLGFSKAKQRKIAVPNEVIDSALLLVGRKETIKAPQYRQSLPPIEQGRPLPRIQPPSCHQRALHPHSTDVLVVS